MHSRYVLDASIAFGKFQHIFLKINIDVSLTNKVYVCVFGLDA